MGNTSNYTYLIHDYSCEAAVTHLIPSVRSHVDLYTFFLRFARESGQAALGILAHQSSSGVSAETRFAETMQSAVHPGSAHSRDLKNARAEHCVPDVGPVHLLSR